MFCANLHELLFSIMHRSVPEFKIIRDPLEGDPNFLIMDIQLPKVVSY